MELPVVVKICIGEFCHMKGAEEIVKTFQNLIAEHAVEAELELRGSFCMAKCSEDLISVSNR
jgi:NADH:ubiquinone oxidoreductase subunit E